jgi:hypothetical protein
MLTAPLTVAVLNIRYPPVVYGFDTDYFFLESFKKQ